MPWQHIYQFFLNLFFSEILSNGLSGSDVLPFLEFINKVSLLFYNFIEFIILWYSFLVISFVWYNEYMIWRILFREFSDALLAFACASVIDNVANTCLRVNILTPFS